MAKKLPTSGGRSLVIVESPAKARTIGKLLGRGYAVEASVGHVRDLPQGAKQVPAKYKGEEWAHLGVNVNNQFDPIYVVPPGKSKQVNKLKAALKQADRLYLATDEDREGEAISWHLCQLLKPKVPVQRLVFHEITKEAIDKAISAPRDVDDRLVRAQETRRILDRLYGYEVSPLLWRKVRPRLSAGRVQSVAVRLTVERERARMAFVSASYWDLIAQFTKTTGETFRAGLVTVRGRRIPTGKDFDSQTGKLKEPRHMLMDQEQAEKLGERLRQGTFRVLSLTDKPYTSRPTPPFITSTLQQEANRKLGFTARRTMQVAQSLYETGHITYMRTDSIHLAQVAVEAARDLVNSVYGSEFLPETPRSYKAQVKNAQEAHEAIRPAGHPFELPETMRDRLNPDEFKLFEMIWKRTVASQMADARGSHISIIVEGEDCTFQVGGKTIDFSGYLRAYVEGSDNPDVELADKETTLPSVKENEELTCVELKPISHTTQAPARYSEASLTRSLEELGIGRPSTYASIIDTVLARQYVFKKGHALVPTWVAFSVVKLLEDHLSTLVDYRFTAQMEDDLDTISRGESEYVEYLHKFYFGNGQVGLKQQLAHKIEEIDARSISRVLIGHPEGDEPIYVRVGRYAPFVEQGARRAALREDVPPDEVTVETALELLEQAAQSEEPLGVCPDTQQPVFLKVGRFGPYVQRGNVDDIKKPQNASLFRGMKPEDVDFKTALQLLSLPRTLGQNPNNEHSVVAHNGRFGPYIKCGEETRTLPEDLSPLQVTLEEALGLLAQPKAIGRKRAKQEPLRLFAESPITGQKVQLLHGRYGPYVTDGTTNASLPRSVQPEALTFEEAITLLAERATKGPPKKKKSIRKKSVKKKTKARKKKAVKRKKVAER